VGVIIVDVVGPLAGSLSDFFTNATSFESEPLADETEWWATYFTGGAFGAGGAPIEFTQDSLVDVLGDVFSSIALVKDVNDKVYLNQLARALLPDREDDVQGSFTYVLEEPIGMGLTVEKGGINPSSNFNGSLTSARIYGLDTFVGAEVKVHGRNTIQPKVRTYVCVCVWLREPMC
jgi:hypothetical protein